MWTIFVVSVLAFGIENAEEKNRPVTKVINLLKDMQAQLEKEQATDEEVYDKLACWCETNDGEKTKAIEEAQRRISEAVSTIEELSAKSASLNADIKNLNEEIAKNQDALSKATAIREKELAEFTGEEKDLMQSIQAMKNAVLVLGKHHSDPEALASLRTVLRHHLHKRSVLLQQFLSPADRRTVTAFVQQPAGYQSYAPQSGQIFGILKQMKETFESNLSASQKEELEAQDTYTALKAAKQAEINAAQSQMDNKSEELANTDERLANTKQDLEDTRNALSADQKFLLDLKEKCRTTDAEWEERQKTRADEITAVSQAISILSDDDAHDTFSSTLGLLEERAASKESNERRSAAADVLAKAAAKSQDDNLALLASTVKLDAFTKVKASIDEMVGALTQEQADEVKHRDFCTEELHQTEKNTMVKEDEKSDLQSKIEVLSATMDTLAKDMATLKAEITEMQVQMKRASEDRELENKEFQQTVADQRATQQILNKALDKLKGFYNKAFVQVKQRQEPGADAPPPPAGFDSYKKNAGSGGVMSMIEKIMSDTRQMEAEAIRGEQDSQTAYESFVKNSNDSIATKQRSTVNKTEARAKAEMEKAQAEQNLKATLTDLENLAKYNAEVHQSCDYVMNNFEVRQTARSQEIEALRQAKSILSGSDFA